MDIPRTSPGRRSHASGPKWIRRLGAGTALVVLAAVVLPDLLGLDRVSPFVQLVALRPQVLAVLLGVTAILVAVMTRTGKARLFVAGLVIIDLVAVTMLLPRVVVDPSINAGRSLTVITLNTFEGNADVAAVAELIRVERPDVMTLVEAGTGYSARLAPLVEPLGYRLHSTIGPERADVWGIVAVVADRLRATRVQADTSTPFPTLEVSGGALGGVRVVGFHSMAPTAGELPEWRRDLATLTRWCSGSKPTIVTGDLNATLDHSLLRSVALGCRDAAAARGLGLVATWPAWAPGWLGAQIDHVLATRDLSAADAAIREIPGTDHRAVLARFTEPAGPA